VVLRGINKMSVFDGGDPVGAISFPEIKKTGANTVRIVWAITSDLNPGGPATSTAILDSLITNAKANHLIPMIELHDATGDWTRLGDLVQYWTQPPVVALVQKHQPYLLLNIGNEVGDEAVTQAIFLAGYSAAVKKLRAAGVHTPLVIDASDWGNNLTMLNDTAAALLTSDPDGNLIFSVHLYWSMSCGADAAFITSELQKAVKLDYPLIVGEFSRFGGYPCGAPAGTSICSAGGEVDYETILAVCDDLRVGWYAWEWGPGNDFFDPLCVVMDMTPDRMFVSLKPGWAEEVAISSPYGIKSTSVTPPSI
jgi:mannan endo-1,4-beta-mannosidase